jgi:hypothetical protein
MAAALSASALACIVFASRVDTRQPLVIQPPQVQVDCSPAGIELTMSHVARLERRANANRDTPEFAAWAFHDANEQRRLLRICGVTQSIDPCFDLRRDLWLHEQWAGDENQSQYSAYGIQTIQAGLERARDALRKCVDRDLVQDRW